MKVPYCFFPEGFVRRGAPLFYWLAEFIKKSSPDIELDLKRAEIEAETREYIGASVFSDALMFIFILAIALLVTLKQGAPYPFLVSPGIALLITGFMLFQQMTYPRALLNRKVRNIEKYLLPAMRTMQVQVNSGIPLYNIMASMSKENYGGISEQFRKAVKEINAGMHQINALESLATENPSIHFQRVIWQIVTALKSGSDVGIVLTEMVQSLSEEQVVQIQDYGSKLNPLTMFYMLLVVIVPALAVTFFVVIGSFLSLKEQALKGLFWGMYGFVVLFQFFFISMIASKRPNLL